MSKRDYNVFFNTHTVSGIILSIGLFVVFFAGTFAMFKTNIDRWEANKPNVSAYQNIDYDTLLSEIENEGFNMHGRHFHISYAADEIHLFSGPLSDSTLTKNPLGILPDSIANARIDRHLDISSFSPKKEEEGHAMTLGHFLVDLHWFEQIPVAGAYLSGLIAAFFLFASVTGIIIHWNKIISYFFTFRLKASIKNLWTDAHTTLGVIGLPFQIMFGVTGFVYALHGVSFLPFSALTGFDQMKLFQKLPQQEIYVVEGLNEHKVSINQFADFYVGQVPEESIKRVRFELKNYQDKNAHLIYRIETTAKGAFLNDASGTIRLRDGKLIKQKTASESPNYLESVIGVIVKLHHGDYGGYLLRACYSLIALLTCFMIIAGVMVWLKAREKNKKYLLKRKFNTNVGAIYLGSCLGLYPAIALMFILTKTFPADMVHRFDWISWLFLAFWVGYTVYSFVIKNYFKINKHALILAGAMGVLIPVFNGLHSGLWLWKSFTMGYMDSFFVDLAWLVCGGITLYIGVTLKPRKQEASDAEEDKTWALEKAEVKVPERKKVKIPRPVLQVNRS